MSGIPTEINRRHLSRRGLVYARQSSTMQVERMVGSAILQRQLTVTLEAWGWSRKQIEVIEDLGRPASRPGARRGFDEVLTRMASGTVGIVAITEMSRLARNLVDLARFVEIARDQDVLVAHDGRVTDFSDYTAAFITTILGFNAAREHRAWVQLSSSARRIRAEAGLATRRPPTGYVLISKGKWGKHPEPAVRSALEEIFDVFRQAGSARATAFMLISKGAVVPQQGRRGTILWKPPTPERVIGVLKHPAYAGVFEYGRWADRKPPDKPMVWHENHHEPFISVEEWIANQKRLADNQRRLRRPALRRPALLRGLLRCSLHDRPLKTAYLGREWVGGVLVARRPSYRCLPQRPAPGFSLCGTVSGLVLDQVVGDAVVKALAATSVDSIRAACEQAVDSYGAAVQDRVSERKVAEATVAAALQAYNEGSGDPLRRKQLARALDAALRRRGQGCTRDRDDPLDSPVVLSPEELSALEGLLDGLPEMWLRRSDNPEWRLLFKHVVAGVDVEPGRDEWRLTIRWRGGIHAQLRLLTPLGIREVARHGIDRGMSASEICTLLNASGGIGRAGKAVATPFTAKRVRSLMWIVRHLGRGAEATVDPGVTINIGTS